MVWWDGQRVRRALTIPSEHIRVHIGSGVQVACEHLQCFGMAIGKETFETAYWIGSIREYCRTLGAPFHRVYRSEVKMHLCQSMRAKDANVRQALIDRFGAVGTKKNPGPLHGVSGHCWSALAVAVTCAARPGIFERQQAQPDLAIVT